MNRQFCFRRVLRTAAILLCLLSRTISVSAQSDRDADSLLQIIRTTKTDTTKIQALNNLAVHLMFSNADTAVILGHQAVQLAERTGIKKEIGNSKSTLGVCYMVQGGYDSALGYLFAAKQIRENLPGQKGLIGCIANIGLVYWRQGNYPKALEYYLNAYDLDQKKGDREGMAIDLANIGNVYSDQNDTDRAVEYYSKALHLDSILERKAGIAAMQGNLGIIWYKRGQESRALNCFRVAYLIDSALGNDNAVARHLGNAGDVYKDRGERALTEASRDSNYTTALSYLTRALELDRKTGDQQQQAMWLTKLGSLTTLTKDYNSAQKYLDEALLICKDLNELLATLQAEEATTAYYAAIGQWQKAYEHSQNAAGVRSRLFNDEKSQELGRAEANAKNEKQKALDDAAHKNEIDTAAAVAAAEQRKQIVISALAAILALSAVVIALVVFRSLRTTRKQKSVIEEQKLIVEEKNKAIVDSITYARRLQEAILPSVNFWKTHLPDSFILYKPKDIVAGDFYWMEVSGDRILFAVADCTGHGVPGALVSVVCSTALSRAVNEFGLTDPGKILDKVCELVLSTFEKSESIVSDGMDISLCSLQKSSGVLTFAGANNSGIIVRDGTVTDLPANKQPVGKSDHKRAFTNTSIQCRKGDVLYLFSDGYADQFGGPKGKKFKHRALIEKLNQISALSAPDQKAELNSAFEHWKGNLEQVDDVCISGIRL